MPLHSELHTSLLRQRCSVSGVSSPIGQILEHWVDKLKDPYVDYCAGLIRVRSHYIPSVFLAVYKSFAHF